MAEIKTVLTDTQIDEICEDPENWAFGKLKDRAFARAIEAAVLSASAGKVDADLLSASREFYNRTIADCTVRIHCFDSDTQLAIISCGEKLRAAIQVSLASQAFEAQQAIDSGKV